MKRRLAVVLVLVVVLPIGLLGWLGSRLAGAERQNVERRFADLLAERLVHPRNAIAQHLEEAARELDGALAGAQAWTPQQHDEFRRAHPLARQSFVLTPAAELVHPRGPNLTPQEWAFLQRVRGLVERNPLLFRAAPDEAESGDGAPPTTSGWSAWYEGAGIVLIHWKRLDNGFIAGAEIDRVRLTADIIGLLPDTPTVIGPRELRAIEQGHVRLLDERGNVLYQWGRHEPAEDSRPVATMALDPPLAAWTLEYFAPPELLAASPATQVALWSGLAGAGAALVLLALYLYREYRRDLRDAERRVNFVNQVSHELKTPLTNIRMYAELLDEQLAEDAGETRRHLGIIVSESQRLSRLIDNVLTFSRDGRGKVALRLRPVEIDSIVGDVLEQFRPSLADKGFVKIETELRAPRPVECDADAIGQILANLIGNVEKYAADGAFLRIETEQDAEGTRLRVIDRGPGIPPHAREKVFRPFYRLDNSLTSAAAGTGIGLAIARTLARMHGGDLLLQDSERGAVFELQLPATIAAEAGGVPR